MKNFPRKNIAVAVAAERQLPAGNLWSLTLRSILLLTALLFWSLNSFSQGLIISQYIETNSGTTPKGIELWNQTGATIDFSSQNLEVFKGTNGGALSSDVVVTSGTLANGAVMVIGTTDMGTYLSNQGLGSVLYVDEGFTFNGDDALSVELGGVVQDVFGTPGIDPGSSWEGNGVSTANRNIALLCDLVSGDIDGWSDPSERFEDVATGTDLTGFGVAPQPCGGATCIIDNVTFSNLSACNPADNSYTVDVTVEYTNEPAGDMDVNGQLFAITSSPQTVQISGDSDGQDVDVVVSFTLDPACSSNNPALFTAPGACQASSEQGLIISQYIETNSGSTPKGIELWNQTGGTIDFSVENLDIQKGTNGAPLSSDVTITSGTLADGAVMVIGTSDMGTYLANQGLGSVLFVDYGFTFNGDDALAVVLDGVVEDGFGTEGIDPGSAWTGGGVSTANENIALLCDITTGEPAGWSDPSVRFATVAGGTDLTGFGVAPQQCGGTACSIENVSFSNLSACDPQDNSYTVDVTVEYTNGPGGNLVVNGETFAMTASPQTVQLTGDSDGQDVDVEVSFALDPACTSSNPALFTAPSNCEVSNEQGLIISQYTDTDGGTTPKGVELWNQTGSTIDFSVDNLVVLQGTNGGALSPLVTVNSGTLADGAVMVIGTSDMGTYLANQGLGGVLYIDQGFTFNGDDALSIELAGVTEDTFGNPGQDPGSAWTGGGVSTADENIALLCDIVTGAPSGWTDPSLRFATIAGGTDLTGFGVAPQQCGGSTCSIDNVSFSNLSACDPQDNSYSVDITVEYTDGPGGNLLVNGEVFAMTSSPQTVQLTGDSDGQDVDVEVSFAFDPACTSSNPALFTAPSSCFVPAPECGNETFSLMGTGTGSYQTISFVGDDGFSIEATDARADQDINGDAITVRDGALTVFNAAGGVGSLTLTTQRVFSGGSGVLEVFVDGNSVGTVPYDASVQTTTIDNIDVGGMVDIVIATPGNGDRIAMDDLIWTCFTPAPDNNDCVNADNLSVPTFPSTSSVLGTLYGATDTGVSTCEGSGAGGDVFYTFTLSDENHVGVTVNPYAGADVVVEVWDGCTGTTIACINNAGSGDSEIELLENLAVGTYTIRVHNVSGVPEPEESASFLINVQQMPYAKVQDNPNSTLFACNQSDFQLEDFVGASPQTTSWVLDYEWLAAEEGGGAQTVYQRTEPNYVARISWLGMEYGKTYNVFVRVLIDHPEFGPTWGVFQGDYQNANLPGASACTISTASDVSPTELRPNYTPTNAQGNNYGLCDFAIAYNVQDSENFRWRFDGNGTPGDAEDIIYTRGTGNPSVRLSWVNGLIPGATYQVAVEVQVAGQWSGYSTVLPLSMALTPNDVTLRSPYCGGTYAPNGYILSESVCEADLYQFRFTPTGGGTASFRNSGNYVCFLSGANPALVPGDYDVQVKVTQNGVPGDWGPVCTITISGPQGQGNETPMLRDIESFSTATLFPNPNAGQEVRVNLDGLSDGNHEVMIQVYDVYGKLIINDGFGHEGNTLSRLVRFDSDLANGMYMVQIVVDGERFVTERLIVK